MLFSDQRIHKLTIPTHDADGKAVTIAYLITHLCENVMKDNRKELFVLDDHMYAPSSSCSPFISEHLVTYKEHYYIYTRAVNTKRTMKR